MRARFPLLLILIVIPTASTAQPIRLAANRVTVTRMVDAVVMPSHLAGRRSASGIRYDPRDLTAAHPWLPLGSLVAVRNPANGRQAVVQITDRGPFGGDANFAVSEEAGIRLGMPMDEPVPLVLQGVARPRMQEGDVSGGDPGRPEDTGARIDESSARAIFAVQLASFGSRPAADAKAAGVPGAWIQPVEVDGSLVYRVYYGSYHDRSSAERWRAKLATRGIVGFVKQVSEPASASG